MGVTDPRYLTTVITWSDSKVLLGAPPLAIAPRMDVPTHLETLSEHRVMGGHRAKGGDSLFGTPAYPQDIANRQL